MLPVYHCSYSLWLIDLTQSDLFCGLFAATVGSRVKLRICVNLIWKDLQKYVLCHRLGFCSFPLHSPLPSFSPSSLSLVFQSHGRPVSVINRLPEDILVTVNTHFGLLSRELGLKASSTAIEAVLGRGDRKRELEVERSPNLLLLSIDCSAILEQ